MEAAILIAGGMILAGLWSVSGALGELRRQLSEDLQETNSRLRGVGTPLKAIRRVVAPTEYEIDRDEPDIPGPDDLNIEYKEPPYRLYSEVQRGVNAAQRIASSLERMNARQRKRRKDEQGRQG